MEAPEVEGHHSHHHTGHRWVDLLLAGCAILISVISLFLGIHHGHTMEKLVQANTWPYLDYGTSNATPAGGTDITLQWHNAGVGPARVETFEVFYKDKAVASPRALLDACCQPAEGAGKPRFITSSLGDMVLPARETTQFLRMRPGDSSPEVMRAFDQARASIASRVCYCSVFDECWLRDSRQRKPEAVKTCPTPATPYRD